MAGVRVEGASGEGVSVDDVGGRDLESRDFELFAITTEPRLRRALVARYGIDIGVEATSDAMAYAWEHWQRLSTMTNPTGYLWRVAQSSVRRQHRWSRRPTYPAEVAPPLEGGPSLPEALFALRSQVRVAVMLVHGYDWTYAEVAELLGVPVSTVRNHVHRGLKKLREGREG